MFPVEMFPDQKRRSPYHSTRYRPGLDAVCPLKNRDHWGMIPENSRQVMSMKQTLYDGSRKTTVNTRYDECLYLVPRPVSHAPEVNVTGKDLYMHVATDPDKRITYYLHLWSNSRTVKEKILPMSPSMVDRFLKSRGLDCNLFPKNDPVARLYAWGYGIAEEF